MKDQLTYHCDDHSGQSCPRQVIKYYKENGKIIEIGLCDITDFSNHEEGCINYTIYYCPWCGTKIQNEQKE